MAGENSRAALWYEQTDLNGRECVDEVGSNFRSQCCTHRLLDFHETLDPDLSALTRVACNDVVWCGTSPRAGANHKIGLQVLGRLWGKGVYPEVAFQLPADPRPDVHSFQRS